MNSNPRNSNMAACMLCRFMHSISGSAPLLQKPLVERSVIFKNVHRSSWYRSFFQSDHDVASNKSTHPEVTRNLSSSNPAKPKQPPNVFLLYIKQVQDIIKIENPTATRRDIVNEASKRWKEIDPEEKARLTMERKEMYDRFKVAEKLYLENLTPEQIKMDQKEREKKERKKLKKARKDLGMPGKPWSSYKWFLSEKFAERADEDIRTYFKQSKDLWMRMPEDEKEVYSKKQREGQVKYQRDMMEWEENMIEDGRFDVLRKGTLVKLKQRTSKQKETQGRKKGGNVVL